MQEKQLGRHQTHSLARTSLPHAAPQPAGAIYVLAATDRKMLLPTTKDLSSVHPLANVHSPSASQPCTHPRRSQAPKLTAIPLPQHPLLRLRHTSPPCGSLALNHTLTLLHSHNSHSSDTRYKAYRSSLASLRHHYLLMDTAAQYAAHAAQHGTGMKAPTGDTDSQAPDGPVPRLRPPQAPC